MPALVREISETVFAPDAAAWRAWLAAHHADRHEIWLVMLKRHVDEPSITLPEAVDEAVCYGWIDGQVRRIDERSHALRFTPRKAASKWSQSNKDRVARLSATGRMAAPGLAAVAAAKVNGSWDALTSLEADAAPPDPPRERA